MGTNRLVASEPLQIALAAKMIEVSHLYRDVRDLCTGYASPEEAQPDLRLRITPSDIVSEAARDPGHTWSDGYLETLAVLRKIAEWLPSQNRLLMHGAAISFGGKAYLFCAPSGTGKTTHIRLWHRYLGDAVQPVNGDKPIVRVLDDEGVPAPLAYGTPWAGKEGWQRNVAVPLAAICFLGRSQRCAIKRIDAHDALADIMGAVYKPDGAEAAGKTLELVDALLRAVPLYRLGCNISEDAVRCSFQALTGLSYEEFSRRE